MNSKAIAVETGNLKSARGRITGRFARLGDLSGRGATPAEALADLETQVDRRCTWDSTKVRVIPVRGFVIVLSRLLDGGTEVQMAWPDGHVSSVSSNDNFAMAEKSARLHIAQMLFPSPDAADVLQDDHSRAEFGSWARWQNKFAQIKREQGPEAAEAWRNSLASLSVNDEAVPS